MWVKTITAAIVLSVSGAALADGRHRETEYVYARVVGVQPLMRYVTVEQPRQECWNEVVSEPARPYGTVGPTLAGGIVGAAIGRQFGSGSGRDALTLLGAGVGAAMANQRAERNQAYVDVPVERPHGWRPRARRANRRLPRDVRIRRPTVHDAERFAARQSHAGRCRRAAGRVQALTRLMRLGVAAGSRPAASFSTRASFAS